MSQQSLQASDNLQYVCDMLDQLKDLAGADGGPFLRYLIDMALEEAFDRLRRMRAEAGRSGASLGNERDPAA